MTSARTFQNLAGPEQAQLRILATSDLHVHIFPYDYYADRPSDSVGLARTATLIEAARAEVRNSVLFDNGDFLHGNPMGDYAALGRAAGGGTPHPMIAAMNALGYDAAALGNHEFDFGLDVLAGAVWMAAFPLLCANIRMLPGLSGAAAIPSVRPYVLLDRQLTMADGSLRPLRLGVVGFLPPQITMWARAELQGLVKTEDILAAARAVLPRMRDEGADIIVALAHTGIGPPDPHPGMENAAAALAALPGIDAIVAGHSHLVFPSPAFAGQAGVDAAAGTISGKPAVMPGFWGSHLGLIDLDLRHDGSRWSVSSTRSEARPILRRAPDRSVTPTVASAPVVLNAAAQDHAATLTYVRRAISHSDTALHSYFALISETPAIRLVAEAQRAYVAAALRGTAYSGLPVLSAAAPFKAGGRGGPGYYTDIPAGELALRHLADLYLYPNTIRAVCVTGAMVADWLERSAGIFRRIDPGRPDQVLIDPDFPCYNFDTIFGLTYRIDLSQPCRFGPEGELADPAARRIRDLCLNGRPLDADARVIVATNSYRASGAGGFPWLGNGSASVLESRDATRDILVRHVLLTGAPGPAAPMAWRFAPMPGTSVLFDSAPAALHRLDDVPHLAIRPAGWTEDGFARFRIRL